MKDTIQEWLFIVGIITLIIILQLFNLIKKPIDKLIEVCYTGRKKKRRN